MRKTIRLFLVIIFIILSLLLSLTAYSLIVTAGAKIDEKKLVDLNKTTTYYDLNNNVICEESNNLTVTDISGMPDYVKKAFIAIEDKRFYSHHGVDYHGLARASINNLKNLSFKEGASTISQQLVKNTHLTSEKTFNRKIKEIKLAKLLEKKYSKEEILEKYLNTIYFGENCYGITKASRCYFNKSPTELTLNESTVLAGLIKAPSIYSPFKNLDKCTKRRNIVLKQMLNQHYISDIEYTDTIQSPINLASQQTSSINALDFARNELNTLLEKNKIFANNCIVYTTIDSELEKILKDNFANSSPTTDKSALIIDKNYQIKAYFSTCGEIYRPLGSTIKPILCYAPALEENVVTSYSIINDEKTDFNGYAPSNYADKYLGNTSVKTSLVKSSNVCSVKLLNTVGIKQASKYVNKTDITLTQNDKSLAIALGATEKGAKLSQIVSAYGTFINEGNFTSPYTIDKITDENGKIIYKRQQQIRKIFSDDTCYLVNDMLRETARTGTARKLNCCNVETCAKTGTVGTKIGNTDAYAISYNSNYLMGIWYGNKNNSFMNNSITGGTLPTQDSCSIWNKIYSNKTKVPPYPTCKNVVELNLDKESYNNGKIELADKNSPTRYMFTVLAKRNSATPSISSRFSKPYIEIPKYQVNNKCFLIQLCLPEYYNAKIFKTCNSQKKEIYDTIIHNTRKTFEDIDVEPKKEYVYSIIPYTINKKGDYIYGQEIFLPKIKIPTTSNLVDSWWDDEFLIKNK